MIILRTGVQVPRTIAHAIWINLVQLHRLDWIALYEAVQAARDPGYQPGADEVATLRRWGMLGEGGQMHDEVRAVLLAAAEGDLDRMVLVPPYDDQQ